MRSDICGICGFLIAEPNRGMGYAGNLCTGHPVFQSPSLTESDVRRIVREELARSAKEKISQQQPSAAGV